MLISGERRRYELNPEMTLLEPEDIDDYQTEQLGAHTGVTIKEYTKYSGRPNHSFYEPRLINYLALGFVVFVVFSTLTYIYQDWLERLIESGGLNPIMFYITLLLALYFAGYATYAIANNCPVESNIAFYTYIGYLLLFLLWATFFLRPRKNRRIAAFLAFVNMMLAVWFIWMTYSLVPSSTPGMLIVLGLNIYIFYISMTLFPFDNLI